MPSFICIYIIHVYRYARLRIIRTLVCVCVCLRNIYMYVLSCGTCDERKTEEYSFGLLFFRHGIMLLVKIIISFAVRACVFVSFH